MIHRLVPATFILVCATATPALANTNAQSSAHTADVELVQTTSTAGKSASRRMVFSVSLVDDAAPATIKSRATDGEYEISLRRETARTKNAQPTLWLELGRHAARSTDSLTVRASSAAPVGQRTVMLAVDRGDGNKVEVAVTLH